MVDTSAAPLTSTESHSSSNSTSATNRLVIDAPSFSTVNSARIAVQPPEGRWLRLIPEKTIQIWSVTMSVPKIIDTHSQSLQQFPHMFVMDGGYKAFWTAHPELCSPQGGYVSMWAPEFAQQCKSATRRFRQSMKPTKYKSSSAMLDNDDEDELM